MGKGGPSWNREGGKVGYMFQFQKSGIGLSLSNVKGGDPLGSERGIKVGHEFNF